MQTRAGKEKQNKQTYAERNKQIQNKAAIKKPAVRTTELSKMIQLVRTDPESISRDEFKLLQSAIGYRQAVKLMEDARLQNKLEKEKQPETSLAVQKENLKPAAETEEKPAVVQEKKAPELKEQPEVVSKQENAEVPEAKDAIAAMQTEDKAIEEVQGTETTEVAKITEEPKLAAEKDSTEQRTIAAEPVMEAAADTAEKKQAPKAQQVKIKGEDPGQILEQLGKVPPTEMQNAYFQAAGVSAGALEKQRNKAQEAIPQIPAPTGLAAGNGAAGKASSIIKPIGHKELAGFKSEKTGGNQAGMLREFNAGSGNEPDPEEIMSKAREYASNAPKISMTGEADPTQVEGFKTEAAQNVQTAKKAELSQTNKDFGENKIVPEQDHSILKAEKGISAAVPPAIQTHQAPVIPPEVAGRMNPTLTPMLESFLTSRKSEYQKGREKYDLGITAAKTDTNTQIESLKTEAKEKQLKEQAAVKNEVRGYKTQWQNEINTAASEYDREAGTAADQKKKEIKGIKDEKEAEVKTSLKEAEKEAGKEYKTAKTEADSKKKEGEKDNRNIFQKAWDWTKEKAQKALDAIKKAVNTVFNKLRQAVKTIFDKAKKAALSLIEKGRQLITNVIKGLGKLLKDLVKKVFSRFPGISKRICGLIDKAVDKAVKAVNLAASLLKKGVTAALNLMAKTVDKLFAAVQTLYNGILKGIDKFLNSDFKTIFNTVLEAAQIAAEIALAFATGGGSILLQIVKWLATTLPQLFQKAKAVLGFVDTIRNLKLEDAKKLLNPAGIGGFLVKGLFGELNRLPEGEAGEEKEGKEPEAGREEKGLMKVFHIMSGLFKTLKGTFGKVAGAINKILPAINISNKPWFDPFSMIYAGAVKALEIVKNPAEALNAGAEKLKEAAAGFFKSIKTKLAETAGSIKEKIMLLGQPAQLIKLIANKAVDMVLNFIITHPPSALIKAAFKAVEAASGKSIVELVRQYIPFADKLINKIAESGPVQALMKPLEQPVKTVGGMIDQVSEKAVGMVEDSEQKATTTLGSGAKLLTGLAGVTIGAKAATNKAEGKKGEGGDFLGSIKGGIHTRLLAFGQKLLQSGKALLMKGVDKLKGMLTPKVKFRLGSEEHELWVVKGSTRNIVMMASEKAKIVWEHEKVSREIKENDEFKKGVEELESSEDGKEIPKSKVEKVTDKISQNSSAGVSDVDFGKHLRSLIGDPPSGMVDPHAHHILFKEGHGDAQKALVKEGQELLRRYNIDPIMGKENLAWAPNRVQGQHGIEALQNVVNKLKQVENVGGDRDDIIKMLKKLGELAAERR